MIEKSKIIISGGFGHISWSLAKILAKQNTLYLFENGLMNRPTPNDIPPNVNIIYDDIRNIQKYDIHCDLFFHFGEYSRVEASINEPLKVYNNNIGSVLSVLNYCDKARCKLIYSGSSTKFSDDGKTIYTNPYSFTKYINSEIVREFCKSANLEYAIVYFNNVYGEGESGVTSYATVIEKFLQQAADGLPLTITSPGTQTRAFTHINDTVHAIQIIAKSATGDEFIISSDQEHSIIDIATFISPNVAFIDGNKANRMSSGIRNSKVKKLGWEAQTDLFEYLAKRLSTIVKK